MRVRRRVEEEKGRRKDLELNEGETLLSGDRHRTRDFHKGRRRGEVEALQEDHHIHSVVVLWRVGRGCEAPGEGKEEKGRKVYRNLDCPREALWTALRRSLVFLLFSSTSSSLSR